MDEISSILTTIHRSEVIGYWALKDQATVRGDQRDELSVTCCHAEHITCRHHRGNLDEKEEQSAEIKILGTEG